MNVENITQLLNTSRDLYFILDSELNIKFINRSAECFFNPDVYLNTSFYTFYTQHSNSSSLHQEDFQALLSGKTNSLEGMIVINNIEHWKLNWVVQRIDNDYILCCQQSRLLANTEPDIHQKYLQNVIEFLPEYIYWKDVNFAYLGCNRRVSEYLQLDKPSDIIGKTDHDFDWSPERIKELRRIDTLVIQGVSNVIEEQIPLPGMPARFMLTNKSPMYDADGNIIGIVGVSTDITELKNVQNELKVAVDKVESASKSKSEFIANLSHDIRTPITGILSIADYLYRTFENPEAREQIQILIESSNELLNLFNDILEVSQLDSGLVKLFSETFSINKIVSQTVNLLRPNINKKNLQCVTKISSDCPEYLYGDRWRLRRIVLNLVSNAITFTQQGSITISVDVVAQENDNVTIKLSIKDTGIGIKPENFEKIFEQFTRLSPSYGGKHKGTGLGLFMIKQYVELMGGQIRVESELGSGSDFIVTIPFKLGHKENITNTEEDDNSWKVPSTEVNIKKLLKDNQHNSSKLQVLVVEDSQICAVAAVRVLNDLHCHCEIANSGDAAIKMSADKPYDIILMDIGLPDMSGIEATSVIRQNADSKNTKTPIIALTGHMVEKQRQTCLEANMNGMLTKPMTSSSAGKLLRKFFSNTTSQVI